MAARPSVGIRTATGEASGSIPLPAVFSAPLRHDIVRFVHTNLNKNARQPYAVSRRAGHRATAESWGTGRAVSRIPRVGGGGTSRSGEGAYGNMCKGGRMFAPTKVFRRWNRAVNKNLRRYAVTSSVVASGIPALVMARGHKIEKISELPLVVSDKVQGLTKTKDAVKVLKALKAFDDVTKVKDTTKVRAGVGKMRNRRYVQRKGPLVVLSKNEGGWRAFRNIPGIDLAFVTALNILQLAPGGHLGRFIIWSESAFRELDNVFGTLTKGATTRKYKLPRSIMSNTDVGGVINSDEVQSVLRKKRQNKQRATIKQNPLRNRGALTKLSPYAKDIRRRVKSQLAKVQNKAAGKPAAKPAGKPAAKPAAKAAGKK